MVANPAHGQLNREMEIPPTVVVLIVVRVAVQQYVLVIRVCELVALGPQKISSTVLKTSCFKLLMFRSSTTTVHIGKSNRSLNRVTYNL